MSVCVSLEIEVFCTYHFELRLGGSGGVLRIALALLRSFGSLPSLSSVSQKDEEERVLGLDATYVATTHFVILVLIGRRSWLWLWFRGRNNRMNVNTCRSLLFVLMSGE